MGFNISWVATNGLNRETLYRRLRVLPTGRTGLVEAKDNGVREMPKGWFIVVLNQPDHPLIADVELEKLSIGCRVIACSIDEYQMWSSAEHWTNGMRIWRVDHQANLGMGHLDIYGEPPANFATVERQQRDRQAEDGGEDSEVDHIFDIPLRLAQSIAGFQHDTSDLDRFEMLDWRPPKRHWISDIPLKIAGSLGILEPPDKSDLDTFPSPDWQPPKLRWRFWK